MKHSWYSFLLILLIFSCETTPEKNTMEDFIYADSDFVLTINNLDNFKSNTGNNNFIESLSKTEHYKTFTETLNFLNQIKSQQPFYINLFKDQQDSLTYSFVTKLTDSVFTLDSLKITREPYQLKGLAVEKVNIDKQTIYVSKQGNLLIGSNNTSHLEELFNGNTKNALVKKIIQTQDKDASFSVYLNSGSLKHIFKNTTIPFKTLTNNLTFDTEISQNELVLTGITKATDSSSLINVFKNTLPQDNQLAQITPSNSDGFLSITFNEFSAFKDNLDHYNTLDTVIKNTTLFDNIIEFGEIYTDTTSVVVLNTIDVITTKEALLGEQEKIEDFRGINLYKFSKPDLFKNQLKPFITLDKATKYCIINQFIIFASNTDALENVIINYQNQTTLNDRQYYKDISAGLSSQASILQVLNPDILEQLVSSNLNTTQDLDFSKYKSSAFQFIYDGDFAHFNAIIKQSKTTVAENSITEMFNIKLDNDVLNTPQFVKNYRTKQQNIIVQDVTNKLYLITNDGKILWKKQLHGPVLGRIEQIDMYKNGRLQYTFATPNRVYVLDRNGNDVKPFPMKFSDQITQPLSVFDYDKRKKYRLFVTQGKNVLLYDGRGKKVKGFNFKSAKEDFNSQPQHIRIGRKDYLVFKTDHKLYILDRRGKTRVTPKTSLSYSNQPVFDYNSDFITTTKEGKLATITTKGTVSVMDKNLTDNNSLVSTTKTLVSQSNNILNIKDQTLELDFGSYTPAQLFLIDNKIYVSTTDKQTQKVLLYDSNGVLQDNFPVYGTSAIDLENIDKDSNLEFVTKGESNSILVYKIN